MRGVSADSSVSAEEFVGDGGDVMVGKLASTVLGATWLAFVTGLNGIFTAFAQVHIEILRSVGSLYSAVITAYGQGGAATLRLGWGSAFRAAVDASPLFAPVLMSLELGLIAVILVWARRRWY